MSKICGAGILPFCISPEGVPYFLLGRERISPGWRGSNKISAFEGGHKTGESIVQNAIREFGEESLCILMPTDESLATLSRALESGDYALRVGVSSLQREEHHWTFVKEFAWHGIKKTVRDFEHRRIELLGLQWIGERIAELDLSIPRQYPFLREGDTLCVGEWGMEERLYTQTVDVEEDCTSRLVHLTIVCTSECSSERRKRRITVPLTRDGAMFAERARLCSAAASRLKALEALAPTMVQYAVNSERTPTGSIVSLSVRSEWLEKASVDFYTLEQLAYSLSSNRQTFRPYFALVLAQTLAQFRSPSSPGSFVQTTV
jgi:hypothetical protein